MPPIDPTGLPDCPYGEFDEHGTWICPECHNDGAPNGCPLFRLLDGSD